MLQVLCRNSGLLSLRGLLAEALNPKKPEPQTCNLRKQEAGTPNRCPKPEILNPMVQTPSFVGAFKVSSRPLQPGEELFGILSGPVVIGLGIGVKCLGFHV